MSRNKLTTSSKTTFYYTVNINICIIYMCLYTGRLQETGRYVFFIFMKSYNHKLQLYNNCLINVFKKISLLVYSEIKLN